MCILCQKWIKEALKATRGSYLKQERFICISARCLLPVRDWVYLLLKCLRQGQPAKQTASHTHTHTTIVCLKHINVLICTHANIYRIHSFYMRLLAHTVSLIICLYLSLSVIIFFITTGSLINSSLCVSVFMWQWVRVEERERECMYLKVMIDRWVGHVTGWKHFMYWHETLYEKETFLQNYCRPGSYQAYSFFFSPRSTYSCKCVFTLITIII